MHDLHLTGSVMTAAWLVAAMLSVLSRQALGFRFAARCALRKLGGARALCNNQFGDLTALQGTPEIVGRLQSLRSKFPGIELNINVYKALYPFPLDQFQEDSLLALVGGKNVVVTTPTGSGKTLVGELAIYYALMMGKRVVYTTPLKALSNQKFNDLKARFGAERVGLLTGDVAINRDSQITVMTTEVFRNILYSSDSAHQVDNLFMVCFDEFHFMNDKDRGTVWEESVISCPTHVRLLALSATMGNVEDVCGWMSAIHSPTVLATTNERPVPLQFHFATATSIQPFFEDPHSGPGSKRGVQHKANGSLEQSSLLHPRVLRDTQAQKAATKDIHAKGWGQYPRYSTMVEELRREQRLPALVFIFSRKGCEDAARMLAGSKPRLLAAAEVHKINQAVLEFLEANPDIPVSRNAVNMLQMGIAVHHAGQISVWKAFIERLFAANLLKVIFATETLAAGVNMPARTTVITTTMRSIKGENVSLKPSQILQMAGRAGRRGMDVMGHVVLVKNSKASPHHAHKLLTARLDEIQSHFKASYAMTVQLCSTRSEWECRKLVEKSFGTYLQQRRTKKRNLQESPESIAAARKVIQELGEAPCRQLHQLAARVAEEERGLRNLLGGFVVGRGVTLGDGTGALLVGPCPLARLTPHAARLALEGTTEGDWHLALTTRGLLVVHRGCVPAEPIDLGIADETWATAEQVQSLWETVVPMLDGEPDWIHARSKESPTPQAAMVFEWASHEDVLADLQNTPVMLKGVEEALKAKGVKSALKKQHAALRRAQADLGRHHLYDEGHAEEVIAALTIIDKMGSAGREAQAWTVFQNVAAVLREYDALQGTAATPFGNKVSSFSSDNDLWAALVFSQEDLLNDLDAAEVGAVAMALNVDPFRAQGSIVKHVELSAPLKAVLDKLELLMWGLRDCQRGHGLDVPLMLAPDTCGLAAQWARGVSWRDLCALTSLEQGDLCRSLKRTADLLRQVHEAVGVSSALAAKAKEAAKAMDRFPVAEVSDEEEQTERLSTDTLMQSNEVPSRGVGFARSDEDTLVLELRKELRRFEEGGHEVDATDEQPERPRPKTVAAQAREERRRLEKREKEHEKKGRLMSRGEGRGLSPQALLREVSLEQSDLWLESDTVLDTAERSSRRTRFGKKH